MFMPYGGPQDAYSCNGRQSPREFAPRHHSDIVADEPYGRAAPGLPSGSFLRFHSASAIQQHPIKRDQQMIQADAVEESPSLLGVCDGVSEVQKMGIRPDEFPKELLLRCREALETRQNESPPGSPRNGGGWPGSDDGTWLMHLLEEAYLQTESQGSCTALLTAIEDCNRLVVSQLGDCMLLLLRPTQTQPPKLQVVFRTEPLRYDENKPYQVARLEGVSEERVQAVIQRARIDTIPAHHGDIVVMGSDGLFDNLHEEDVVRLVEAQCCRGAGHGGHVQPSPWGRRDQFVAVPTVDQLESAADTLVSEAMRVVCQPFVDEHGHRKWPDWARQTPVGMGGKPDDTSAVVACLVMVDDLAAHEESFYQVHNPGGRQPGLMGLMTNCCGAPPGPANSERSRELHQSCVIT